MMYLSHRIWVRSVASAFLAAIVMLPASAVQAPAQQSQTQTAAQFLTNPGQLLQSFPDGGLQMALRVQQFAMADAATTSVLLGLIPDANPRQKAAIGEGLALAARILATSDQSRAADIQQWVSALNDAIVNVAFLNTLGDVKIGAANNGRTPGDAGGQVGGQTNQLASNTTFSGPPAPIGTSGTTTPSFTITSSVASPSSVIETASTVVVETTSQTPAQNGNTTTVNVMKSTTPITNSLGSKGGSIPSFTFSSFAPDTTKPSASPTIKFPVSPTAIK